MTPPVISSRATHPVTLSDVGVTIDSASLLRNVSLTVEAGEWLCIIGPNGAGKSTLLRAIAGLTPFTGSVSIGNQRFETLPPRERARTLAFVPQNHIIPPGIAVMDYVLLGRNPWIAPLGKESTADHEIVGEVLHQLDAEHLVHRELDTLSGGERQRIVVARALAQQAPVLLLDEPTTALDIGHQQDLLNLLDQLRTTEGLTLISTMHDLSLAGQYADRLALLSCGELMAVGSAAEVLTADAVNAHYRASVRIITESDGTILVVPDRATASLATNPTNPTLPL